MDINDILRQVKHNCNISDAKFWGYYSICGLLMRYRELYLSEHSLMPWDSVSTEAISFWISKREALWKDIEDEELHTLVLNGITYDPFDINRLNTILKDSGLIYGSGYGTLHKPTFFIARLNAVKELYDYRIYYTGEEICRDLSAFPAMLQGRCIYIRLDVLRTILWDKFQTLKAGRYKGFIEEMFSDYNIKKTDIVSEELIDRIEAIAKDASDLFVLHEVGEAFEDTYADDWAEILGSSSDKHCELLIRTAKDLLADTSELGPLKSIITEKNKPLLNVYMAFLDGIRKELFPEIRNAFQQSAESNDWSLIENARRDGHKKAGWMRDNVLRLWKEHDKTGGNETAIKQYFKDTFAK